MAYYPLSQIKTNLYTDGTEYTTPDGNPYIGFYFLTSTGDLFTGKTPQDTPNFLLSPLRENQGSENINRSSIEQFRVKGAFEPFDIDPDVDPKYLESVFIYDEYTSITGEPPTTTLPYYSPVLPTEQDYSIGEFRRYFCKKSNEIKYIEINKDQYDLLVSRDPQILWQLYKPFYLNWDITGDKQQVAQINKNITELASRRKKLPRLGDYLKNDYLKYYK